MPEKSSCKPSVSGGTSGWASEAWFALQRRIFEFPISFLLFLLFCGWGHLITLIRPRLGARELLSCTCDRASAEVAFGRRHTAQVTNLLRICLCAFHLSSLPFHHRDNIFPWLKIAPMAKSLACVVTKTAGINREFFTPALLTLIFVGFERSAFGFAPNEFRFFLQ